MNLPTANTKRRKAVRYAQEVEKRTWYWRKGISLLANFMTRFADDMAMIPKEAGEMIASMRSEKDETI